MAGVLSPTTRALEVSIPSSDSILDSSIGLIEETVGLTDVDTALPALPEPEQEVIALPPVITEPIAPAPVVVIPLVPSTPVPVFSPTAPKQQVISSSQTQQSRQAAPRTTTPLRSIFTSVNNTEADSRNVVTTLSTFVPEAASVAVASQSPAIFGGNTSENTRYNTPASLTNGEKIIGGLAASGLLGLGLVTMFGESVINRIRNTKFSSLNG